MKKIVMVSLIVLCSETQVYSLSFINERTLNVIWMRHVNNYRNGGNNEDWHLKGEGQLRKN
jgi:hypothetical protein